MPTVYLTRPLRQLAVHLAQLRNAKEEAFGAMTYGLDSQEAHEVGVYAEIAVAHWYDVPVDVAEYERGDDGVDLCVQGYPLAVKATTYTDDPWLRVEVEHYHPRCHYLCCVVDGAKVELIGYATPQEVREAPRKRLVEGGPMNYVMRAKDLHSIQRP